MRWSGKERRGFIRARFPCRIIVHGDQEKAINSHTENIGAGGVRVILEEFIDMSTAVEMQIYLKNEPIDCQGRVVWTIESKSDLSESKVFFDVGIEFFQMSADDRLTIESFVNSIY